MPPRRPFGRHPDQVSILGLGGYHLGMVTTIAEAVRIVHAAIDGGINFLDNAWEYHDGESEERMGRAIRDRRDQVFLMTKVCTHGRDAEVAMRQLEESLRRLRTDYLDLWQVHECVYYNDPEAALRRRRGHRGARPGAGRRARCASSASPATRTRRSTSRCCRAAIPFDACQLPLNGFDASFRSFQHEVLPELERQGIAAIGMKSLGGSGKAVTKRVVRVEDALRYAMSLPVCTTVSGIDSMSVLRRNLKIAGSFRPMSDRQRAAYEKRIAAMALDGRFELYKTSAEHEGDVGREQHGFPTQDEVAIRAALRLSVQAAGLMPIWRTKR